MRNYSKARYKYPQFRQNTLSDAYRYWAASNNLLQLLQKKFANKNFELCYEIEAIYVVTKYSLFNEVWSKYMVNV